MNKDLARTIRRYTIIVLLLILIILAFIFSNSLLNQMESLEESNTVGEFFRPFLEGLFGEEMVTKDFVRKLAHCVEFAALGFATALFCMRKKRVRLQNVSNCVFVCLAAAVTDESIQIFTGRGPMVQDILLDFASAMALFTVTLILGLLIRCIFRAIKRKIKAKKEAKKEAKI